MSVAMSAFAAWARAFVLTELVEAPIYRATLGARLGPALAASAITHPFVWFAFPWLADRLGASWTAMAIAAELFAWLVEALFFVRVLRVRFRRAAVASLVANGASVVVGLALRAWFDLV